MRIGVMCSGNGTNFENIVENCPDHEVVVMIYNIKGCGAQERADRLGIPNCRIKSIDEQKIIDKLNRHKVDLVVLAGWMRIVTPGLINAFPNKIINIHPSLLPKYKGLNAVKQALDSGDKITGCTVHYVTEELDSGGCIDSSSVPICVGDTEETLHHRVQRAEHRLLPMVINNLFDDMEWEWFIELLQMRQDKIDTQGMSIPSKGNINSNREIPPMPVKHRTIFTPEERRELKDIVNEALDERWNEHEV